MSARAYIAGPLFDEGERWWIERVEQTVSDAGFITFLPHRDNPPKDQHNVAEIFANDRRGINECDVVVAGYAFALGKPIIGLHTDWRRRFDHEVINLMIECSLTVLLRSIDELPGALVDVVPATR